MTESKFLEISSIWLEEGVAKDYEIVPPIYYSSLRRAFKAYCEIYKNDKDLSHYVITNFTDSTRVPSVIIHFHHFFEVAIKFLLHEIDPALILTQDNKTINFEKVIKLFRQNSAKAESNSKIKHFEFIVQGSELMVLSKWRNEVIHFGRKIPPMNVFEYFISQKIFPLIKRILKVDVEFIRADYDKTSFEDMFKTPSGIDLIKKICNQKFKYKDAIELNDLYLNACRELGKLKEMGRAMISYDIIRGKNTSFHEHLHPDPIGRAIRASEAEVGHKEALAEHSSLAKILRVCPVCSNQSLIEYEFKKTYNHIKELERSEASINTWNLCFTCSYSLTLQRGINPYFTR